MNTNNTSPHHLYYTGKFIKRKIPHLLKSDVKKKQMKLHVEHTSADYWTKETERNRVREREKRGKREGKERERRDPPTYQNTWTVNFY